MTDSRLAHSRIARHRDRLADQGKARVELWIDQAQIELLDDLRDRHGCPSRTELIRRILTDPTVQKTVAQWPAATP